MSLITTQLVHHQPLQDTMPNQQTVTIRLSLTGTILSPTGSHLGGKISIRADNPTIQKINQEVKSQLVLKGYLPQSGWHVCPASEEIVAHVFPGMELGQGGDMMRDWRAGDEVAMHTRLEVECSLSDGIVFIRGVSVI